MAMQFTNLSPAGDVKVKAGELFPAFAGATSFALPKWNDAYNVPVVPKGYLADEVILRKAVLWLLSDHPLSLMLKGETGTGKTELVSYMCGILGLPMTMVRCNGQMTADAISGSKELIQTETGTVTKFVLSAAMEIYRNGGVILLDEVDKANMEFHEKTHTLIEGKPITIEETGEVITKHPRCKIIGTANTVGDGSSERYISSKQMDEAYRLRWCVLELKYLTPVVEAEMLKQRYPRLKNALVNNLVRLANDCRDAALGPKRDGNVENPMIAIVSTRIVCSICDSIILFGGQSTLTDSFDFSFGMISDYDKMKFMGVVNAIFANDQFKPIVQINIGD